MNLSLEIICEQWNQNHKKHGSVMEYTEKSHTFYRSVRFLSSEVVSLKSQTIYVACHNSPSLIHLLEKASPDTALIIAGQKDLFSYDLYKDKLACETAYVTGCDALETFNRILTIYEKYDEYNSRFLSALSEEFPLQKILDLICEMIGNPAYVVDLNYRALAMDQNQDLPFYSINWKRIREQGYLPYNIVHSIINNSEWDVFRTQEAPVLMNTKEFSTPFLAMNIREKHKIQWRFFACELLKKIVPADIDLVKLGSEYLHQALTSDTSYRSLQEKYYEPFLRQAAAGNIYSRQILLEQLDALKWKENDRYCMMEVKVDGYDGYVRELISKGLKQLAGVLSFQYESRLLILICLGETLSYREFYEKADQLLHSLGYLAAVSVEYTAFSQMNIYCAQTSRILHFPERNQTGCICYQHVFFQDLMSQKITGKSFLSYAPTGYARLTAFDAAHQGNLNETLYQYLRCDINLVKTASMLHIHRNTLLYRLDQIEQLISEDLKDPDVKLWYRMIYEFHHPRDF